MKQLADPQAADAAGDSGSPFFMPEESIAEADYQAVFRLNKRRDSVRAFLRKRSKAKRIVTALPGVHYLRSERAYCVPTELLPDVLRELRSARISFAVSETAGRILQQSAALRRAIIDGAKAPSAEELRRALLVPFVDVVPSAEAPLFMLEAFTQSQLAGFLPKVEDRARRNKLAAALSERRCIEGMYAAKQRGIKIWRSAAAQRCLSERRKVFLQSIKRNRSGFADALLEVVEPACCWSLDENGCGRLSMERGLAEEIGLDKLTAAIAPLSAQEKSGRTLICFADRDLPDAVEALTNVPLSLRFAEKLDSLRVRSALLEVRDRHLHAKDWKLGLKDSRAEERLYPHQRIAAHWITETPRALLGDDMGLGKTLTALAAFQILREREECDYLLVVCPNSLVRNWIAEASKWFSDITLGALPSGRQARERFFKTGEAGGFDGLIVNFETARRETVAAALCALASRRKAFICIDESQRAKNPQSQTFAALRALAERCPRRVLLTGTPTPKDISDIWSQILLLDDGERFGMNYFDWLGTVAQLGTRWSRVAVRKYKPEAVAEAVGRVHEILLRRKKEDVVNLPEKTFVSRDVDLKGDQLRRYEEVRKELLLRVTAASGEEYYREVNSLLEEYLRGVQLASNPRLVDPAWQGEPAKFLELDEIVREVVEEGEQKIVVWTNYLGNVRELVERYSALGAAAFSGEVSARVRAETVRAFQERSEPRVLVAVPAAGGVGITLTAAQTAVYVDKTWNAEHWIQSVDRLHRIGQTGTVTVISLHASKIDRLIHANLRRKFKAQAGLLGDAAPSGGEYPSREQLRQAVS